ncbi:type III pantothenate kinase [Algoriphagus marincola]|uniref:type III pantothenate kinase n=1 Tax=Algoriphagus marincola TaxID=264027 RepID=UPI00040205D0|nr:type III pantothenate kinase [Algoriphagus marincola]
MENLIIDIGNSRIKSALFSGEDLIWEKNFQELAEARGFWRSQSFEHCLISSVRWSKEELESELDFPFIFLTHATPIPIKNGYETPQTLGLDRIAAAVGAWKLSGEKPCLSVDLGSCMTFELVDEHNVYQGGAISPGLQMRAKAMHEFTARLPLVQVNEKITNPLGKKTVDGMRSGIWYGIAYEIEGQIRHYLREYPDLQVFICGGDAQIFDSLAKAHIFVVPNLVLRGLNCILNHHVEQN